MDATTPPAPHRVAPLTPADWVTLTRATMAAGIAVLGALGLVGAVPTRSWPLLLLLILALVLDGMDGVIARRTGTVTARGARWDMEVDAALLLIVCLAVLPYAPWALGIGLARYLHGLGAYARPAWATPLPFRQSRRVIASLQGVALAVTVAPFVPIALAQIVIAAALALLMFSFGRDIAYQERLWRTEPEPGPAPGDGTAPTPAPWPR